VIAAWLRPESNFFLFPVLIAGVLPVSYRIHGSRSLSPGAALGAGTAGIINAVIVAVLLTLAGKLAGPRLVDVGGPMVEATLLALAGGLAGAGVAMLSPRKR
jgi:hypothetical protein